MLTAVKCWRVVPHFDSAGPDAQANLGPDQPPQIIMRSLLPLVVAANVLGALAVPTTAHGDNSLFDSAKAILAQVNALTGNVGAGVLDAVEAAVERAWNSPSEKDQRAQSSVVETNGVRCEY